jgi:hypothetical protein
MSKALANHVGKAYWPYPHDSADEIATRGPSFRIAQILDVTLPCVVFLSHDRAVISATTSMDDLWAALVEEGLTVGNCPNYKDKEYINPETGCPWDGIGTIYCRVPIAWPMRRFYEALAAARKARKHAKLIREHGLAYDEGVFGFTWITKYEWVVGEGETADDVPDHLKGIAEPVKVVQLDFWPGMESGGLPVTDGCRVSPEGPRGCGRRKKGLYASADFSPFGTLHAFTPMSPALPGRLPARTMSYVDFDVMLAADTVDVSEALIGVSGETRDRNADRELL